MTITAEQHVTIEFATNTDAFKTNPQAATAAVLRKIAEEIESGQTTGTVSDPSGEVLEGFWQATLEAPKSEAEQWMERYAEFVEEAYESGEHTREINEIYSESFEDFPMDEIDHVPDFALAHDSFAKLLKRDCARSANRVLLRDMFVREMEDDFQAQTYENYLETFGR